MTGTTRAPGGPGSRPHVWPCRHCDMVADYRLNREAQTQLAEGVFRQDEDYRLTTFKEWLQAFEWDSARERHEHEATKRDAGYTDRPGDFGDLSSAVVPAPRTGDHDRAAATDAAEDVAEMERVEQLTRWHTDDRGRADEHGTDDVADLYRRSA